MTVIETSCITDTINIAFIRYATGFNDTYTVLVEPPFTKLET